MKRIAVASLLFLLLASPPSPAGPEAPIRLEWRGFDGELRWAGTVDSGIAPAKPPALVPLESERWSIRLPRVPLPLMDGTTIEPEDLDGHVVLLDFWASWCAPCLEELPETQALWESLHERGLIGVAINVGESPETALGTAAHLGITMPIGTYGPEVRETFDVQKFPTVIVADGFGRVRGRWEKFDQTAIDSIRSLVERLFDASPAQRETLAYAEAGDETFDVVWMREFPGKIDAVSVSPEGAAHRHVLVSTGRRLHLLEADGSTYRQRPGRLIVGELVVSRADEEGAYSALAFRLGGTRVSSFRLPDGEIEDWDTSSPVLSAVWYDAGDPAGGALAGTLAGVERLRPGAVVETVVDGGIVRGLARIESDGESPAWAMLTGDAERRELRIVRPDGDERVVAELPTELWRISCADEGGFAAPSDGAIKAAAIGRFFDDGERQVAVATDERLVVFDLDDGRERFRARWDGIVTLAAGDLVGDGRERLVVGWGERLAVLEAATTKEQKMQKSDGGQAE